ncbi:MAG: hypothetical protein GXO62_00405 [Epsilonproteobacteria bacterium]|nr:hypothetical protein [Campylobacterota bacterium]
MVAAFFFYYNYKFQTYKFLDFSKLTLYTKNDIFEPKEKEYYLLIFSSKMSDLDNLLKRIKHDKPIIALDIFQKRTNSNKIIYTTAGINTIIKIIQYLNIYEVPVVLKIKKFHKKLYKQDSPLEVIK